MAAMGIPTLLTTITALAALATAGFLRWRRSRQKSPAERERARRLAVNLMGRLTDGVLFDDPSPQSPSPNPDLLFYRYRAAGIEYTAAQDIAALRHLIDPASCRPGALATVKYDPRRPSNSILICELWSGLHRKREGERQHGKGERLSDGEPHSDWLPQRS